MQKIYAPDGTEVTIEKTEERNGETRYFLHGMGNYSMSKYMLDYLGFTFEKPTEDAIATKKLAHELINFIAEEGLYDNGFDLCNDLFGCMSDEEQRKFLDSCGYEDLGYFYDDDREFFVTLLKFMSMPSLRKAEFFLKRYQDAD